MLFFNTQLILLITLFFLELPTNPSFSEQLNIEQSVIDIIRAHPEVIFEAIEDYQSQRQRESERKSRELVDLLNRNPNSIIADSPVLGSLSEDNRNNLVIVEFLDFQCPYCAEAAITLEEFVSKYRNEVSLIYKNFPLESIHPQAKEAARAAWAAQQQDKFWLYCKGLFINQDNLTENGLLELAVNLELDIAKFNQDRHSLDAEKALDEDRELAETLGITGTPFFLTNNGSFAGLRGIDYFEDLLHSLPG
ncbi:MAG: thioredoxin domain-containing protein [Cyanobacteria bacterium P01_D01_bin.56]